MKLFFYYTRRAVAKIVAVPLFVIISAADFVTTLTGSLLRLMAPILAVCTAVIAGYGFTYGIIGVAIQYAVVAAGFGVLYFAVPYLPGVFYVAKRKLRTILHEPVVIRSPIRYTF